MADDGRALEDPAAAIARLTADLADLQSTLLARLAGRPTGDVEMTIRTTAKAGTLLMQGQTVNRGDFPALWAWVQEQSLNGAGKPFGNGDSSTTFVLPDCRGRVPRGVASGEVVGQLTGADSITLTTTHLPSHSHTLSTTGSHDHPAAGGNHGNHNSGAQTAASALPGSQDFFFAGASNVQVGNAAHSHGNAGDHTHTVNNTGSGGAVDIRQAAFAVNWLIYI